MHVPWWLPFGHVDEITPRDLHAILNRDGADFQLLDVRSEPEYRSSHISNAQNVPITVLPEKLAHLNLDPARPVVAICLSAHRSIPAYRLLKRAGFRQVYSLQGGMLAWWREHLPTRNGD